MVSKWLDGVREFVNGPKRAVELLLDQKLATQAILERLEQTEKEFARRSDEQRRELEDITRRCEDLRFQNINASNETEYLKRRLFEFVNGSGTPLFDSVIGKVTRAGLKMFIDGRDYGSGSNILTDGIIEPDVVRLLPKLMRPGGVFLDVGANFGFYTLYGALLGGPRGRVYAFEANPHLIPLINRSIYVNGFPPRVTVFQTAVSDAPGKAMFGFNVYAPGGGGLASAGSSDPAMQKIEVDLARIDDLIGAEVVADCIKIDVEGHELAALHGMEQLLRRSPDTSLIIEYFPDLHSGGEGAIRVIDFLADLGFSFWRITGRGYLADTDRQQLLSGEPAYLVAARKRPDDRSIVLDRNGLELADRTADVLKRPPGEWLVLGPYWPLPSGAYEVTIEGEITGELELVTTHEFGIPISSRRVTGPGQPLGMASHQDLRHFSVIIRGTTEDASLKFDRLVIRDISA